MPGLLSAGIIAPLPLAGVDVNSTFSVEGRTARPGERELVKFRIATPGYFQAIGLGLTQGRGFRDMDTAASQQVAVVNETLVRKYFGGASPLGRRVSLSTEGKGPWLTVVGVVVDVKPNSLSDAAAPELYRPLSQHIFPTFANTLVLRTVSDDPASVAAAVQRRIRQFDAEQPVNDVRPMEEVVARSVAHPKFRTFLLSLFAAVAVALAGAGLYGVLSYTVSQRVREIGIRAALGASRRVIVGTVVGHAMAVVIGGMVLGLAGAYGLTRFISTQLYQVSATDPETYLAVCAVLATVALAAAWAPAWRAVRIDPNTALRCE
jgi:predicted permease